VYQAQNTLSKKSRHVKLISNIFFSLLKGILFNEGTNNGNNQKHKRID
jgi:hypothetical protein